MRDDDWPENRPQQHPGWGLPGPRSAQDDTVEIVEPTEVGPGGVEAPVMEHDPGTSTAEPDQPMWRGDLSASPARRMTLYASGADKTVLAHAAVDESEFVTQGSLVILTSIVAAVAALSATSYLVAGRFVLTPLTVLVGLAWGTLIFCFDRALVSGSLNPYHFRQPQVDSFSDPHHSHWTDLVGADGGPGRRIAEVSKVAAIAFLRIALAVATSYIAAEMVLFLIFQPEVSARTAFLQKNLQQQQIVEIQQQFAQRADQRAAQRSKLTGADDPLLHRLDGDLADLRKRQSDASGDLVKLQNAAGVEQDGLVRSYRLSDGTTINTTGVGRAGPVARSLAAQAAAKETLAASLAEQIATATTTRNNRRAEILTMNKAALDRLVEEDNAAPAAQRDQIAEVTTGAVTGLLLRQAALTMLEHDTNPQTLVEDKIPPCRGASGFVCSVRNAVLPPTPMGPQVAAFRVIFLIIEIFPITYKVVMSLRRRRPYDMVKASMEVAVYADSFRQADVVLHQGSRQVVRRLNERRLWPVRPPPPRPAPDPDPDLELDRTPDAVVSGARQPGLGDAGPRHRGSQGRRFGWLGQRQRRSAERGAQAAEGGPRPPTVKVVVVGSQRAGKTALLAMMYRELHREGGRGYRLRCPDRDQRNQLENNADRVARVGEVWPPKTEVDQIEEYVFECQVVRPDTSEPVLEVHYWDYAGDLLQGSAKDFHGLKGRLQGITHQADVLLLTLDGEMLLKAILGAGAFGTEPGDAKSDLERSIRSLLDVASEGSKQVVHLLVTKWDLFETRGVDLAAVRQNLLDNPDVEDWLLHRSGPVRLIPVAATDHVVAPEEQVDGVIKMVKQEGGRKPLNLGVPFAAVLPDRIEAVVNAMSDENLTRMIKQAKRDRRRFWWYATVSKVLDIAGRLKTIKVPGFEFEKEAADPAKGWAMATFERKAADLADSSAWLSELREVKAQASALVRDRATLVALLRRELDRFEKNDRATILSNRGG